MDRIDDLQCRGYKIYQNPDGYCFTSDSVILANLAFAKHSDRMVDLCTGSGVVGLLMHAKYSPKEIIGVELQKNLAEMAKRSVELNNINNMDILNAPCQDVHKIIGCGFDVVTVNPPYEDAFKTDAPTEEDICKSLIKISLEEIIKESSILLRYGGNFYMINRAKRLADVVFLMRKYGIEPKKIYLIQPKKDKAVDTFVVEGKRGGKSGLTMPPPIVVYDENGEYTEKVRSLYNK